MQAAVLKIRLLSVLLEGVRAGNKERKTAIGKSEIGLKRLVPATSEIEFISYLNKR